MKALVLAAGYAVRLRPITLDMPKALLPIGERVVLDLIIEQLANAKEIDEVVVLTNEKFKSHFEEWLSKKDSSEKISILSDGTYTEEDKLGAIGDLAFSVTNAAIDDDLLVVAGDNIFDFDLNDFISFSKRKRPAVVLSLCDVGSLESAKRYGIVDIDEQSRVIGFQEKPEEPKSTLASMCLYFFPKDKVTKVFDYLNAKNNPDQTGWYIKWLIENDEVFAFSYNGVWYDIGSKEVYDKAIRDLTQ